MAELSIASYSTQDIDSELRLDVEFNDATYARINSTKKPQAISTVFLYPFKRSLIPLAVINQRTGAYNRDDNVPYGYQGSLPQQETAKYLSLVQKLSDDLYQNPDNMTDENNHRAWMVGRQLNSVISKLGSSAYPTIDKEHQN